MARVGLKVDAYDVEPPGVSENVSFLSASGQRDLWHHVGDLSEFAQRVDGRSDYVLFLCWPPGWGSEMASQALTDFEKFGGDRLIFIGEPKGGKTGDDAFFDALSAGWKLESQDERFVSWWNLNDVARNLLEALRDRVTVNRTERDDLEDQEIESSLREIGFIGHVYTSYFYILPRTLARGVPY